MSNKIYTEEYKIIAKNLKKTRLEAGFSQVEVAMELKKPQSYVSKVERGQQRLDVLDLKKFATLYKKKFNYFI